MIVISTCEFLMLKPKRPQVQYPDLQLPSRFVSHATKISVLFLEELLDEASRNVQGDEKEVVFDNDAIHQFSKNELNNLVHNFSFSKSFASKHMPPNFCHKKYLYFSLRRSVCNRYCVASTKA